MKKIIALAVLGLAVTACEPFKDEPSGTPTVISAVVTGRNAGLEDLVFGTPTEYNGPYDGELVGGVWTNFLNHADQLDPPGTRRGPTPSFTATTYGRILVFTTNVLLDGASIEQTPQSCLQVTAAGWVITDPGLATSNPGGQWYTCYYPSSPSDSLGASVYVYYATVAPGVATAAQPIRSGRMIAGDYTVSGTIKAKDGTDLLLKAAWTVTDVP